MALANKLQEEEDRQGAEDAVKEEDKVDEEPKGEPITKFVKQDNVKQLMDMGFSKDASEKALFMVLAKGQSIEAALEWINEHSDDKDFNEPLLIVGKSGEGELKQSYQGNMSKEERLKLAEEKIKAARIRRAAEEKVDKAEAEKNRIISMKAQAAGKRKLDEQEAE